ncbi:helix-turn-helix transcriptional regulator [Streptomyces sp. V4I2]|uniref:helix-turn-helix domain-containing protein n=1 Tax=Streptomyces sp. V4I2 TaxID=3042280 RepID=UPI00277F3114|nr:helix-turn-helix transcriptional regulator [Streptomyces sp. V4I2]MDQ1052005.1 transcriptional regulator with XRE-family HTH domain [Streptomyces sp. V4I2]
MPEPDQATFAAELRRLRGELSLRALALRASCSKSIIGDLEIGRRIPSARMASALDSALGAGGTLVSLAEAERRCAIKRASPGAPDSAVDGPLREWWDDVWRRDFLKSTGAAAAALATSLGVDDTADADSGDLLAAHRDLRAVHGRLDNLRGAQAVYRHAVDHHRQVVGWHATAATASERKRIAALAADTGGFVGFLTYDLGAAELATTHYREAAEHAQEAGDVSSCANLVGQMSRVVADLGHLDRALVFSGRALHLAGTRAHPAVRSWLSAVRAYHHACLGDGRAAQADLGTAWALLERADDGEKPPYIGYLSAAELSKWTGHAMVQLATADPSFVRKGRTAIDDARSDWPTTSVRGSAEVLTTSARIYAADGALDAAADFASRAVTIATKTGSARNLDSALTAKNAVITRTARRVRPPGPPHTR